MLQNFFKVAIRNLWRNKGFSAINIVGLAIGMAAAILILLWVQYEVSFDRFHAKKDRTYLLYTRGIINGKKEVWGRVPAPMADILKKDYAEVEDAIKFRVVYFLLNKDDKHVNVEGAFTDPGFLSTFSFPLLKGDPKSALSGNNNIVLTEHLAKNLFGNEDPMGRIVRIDSTDNFTVTGVLKELPGNTEFTFQYLLPTNYLDHLGWNPPNWNFTNIVSYVVLKSGTSQTAFDTKIKDVTSHYRTNGQGNKTETFTQRIDRIHLYSKVVDGQLVAGRLGSVRLFTIIAGFILLIACINFMNLSTARSEKRAREVGVRKVVGARKSSLVARFIGESILLSGISFILALILVRLSLVGFNRLLNLNLHIDPTNIYFWLSATLFVVFTGVLAGSYPAFYLAKFRPVSVLKGVFRHTDALVTPRKVLVILQFTFALILIISTMIVQRQLQYARDRDAGYDRNQLVFTFAQGDLLPHYDLIKRDLLSSGAAVSVTKLFSPITRAWGQVDNYSWPGSTAADKKVTFLQFEADADFVKTTGTKILQGRDLDIKNYPMDSTSLLLNETAVKTMHLKTPIGTIVRNGNGVDGRVVGVVKDFIMESPYDPIAPMVIQGLGTSYPVVHFRLNPANTTAVNIARATEVFKRYNPQYPFEYYFVDDFYNRKFSQEQQEGSLSLLFAGLTILISCMGLFGLATYMAESRTKEIGIRKVLGASVTGIATMLSGDFIRLVLIAIVIASPIAWLAMNKWLEGYDYRIHISMEIFLIAGVLAILIAVLTVCYQAIRAALAHPVKSLRSE